VTGLANQYVEYTDSTPKERNALDLRDAALNYVGVLWGPENCTGLVWAIADTVGAPYYETAKELANRVGKTEAEVRSIVPDAADFAGYIVPSIEGKYGSGLTQWITKKYTNWTSNVKIGDIVRIKGGVVSGLPNGHSFIIVGGDAQSGWRVIDNLDPDGKTGVKAIKKHTYNEGSNPLFSKILAASEVFISELALPDLQIDKLAASKNVVKVGDAINVDVVVRNYGNVSSDAFSIGIYISRNPTYDSSAIELVTFKGVKGLAPGAATDNLGMSVIFDGSLNSHLFSGTNYLIVMADYDDKMIDLNRDNNSYHIAITLDNTFPEEPQSTLPVAVGGIATISTEFLLSTDNYSGPEGLTYTIVTAPGYGTLLLDGAATSTFTQADIDIGRVQYRQDGAFSTRDGFTFTVADEAGNWIGPEPFTIAILDTTDPVVFENNAVTVSSGGGLLIWKDMLSTVAVDNKPTEMIYTILAAPSHGALIIDNQPVTSFTQADIDNGYLHYVQPGGPADGDSFSFVVTDGTGKQTALQTFQIRIEGGTAVANDPVGIAAPLGLDAILADLIWQAPATTETGEPAAFGFADVTISSAEFAGWSDDFGTAENGDTMLAAYLEMDPRWDDTGDSGGSW
jgi:hypothetical protein